MLDFTDEEKKIISDFREDFADNASHAIEEGLVSSYSSPLKNTAFKETIYNYLKRVLVEVAKKRDLDFNSNESFKVNEIIKGSELFPDFKPEFFEDINILEKYIHDKVSNMNLIELEEFKNEFCRNYGIIDSIRDFMSDYIPDIMHHFYRLKSELDSTDKDSIEFNTPNIVNIDENAESQDSPNSDYDDDWLFGDIKIEPDYDFPVETPVPKKEEEKINDEKLIEFIKFLNSFNKLMKLKTNGLIISTELNELYKNKKLQDFYSDEKFYNDLKTIMNHDKTRSRFLFHGTQSLGDAESIMKLGLGMMRSNLSSTTYSEFSMDDLLLYSRGMFGEIGSDAIVVIDNPIDENGRPINIVEDINKEIPFSPSGLQGLNGKPNYIIDPKYIVGYVNKRDKKIVFNPLYYKYNNQEYYLEEQNNDVSFHM